MAEGDVGNLRSASTPPMSPGVSPVGMNLRSADFEWVTMELVKIADICCNGRLVCFHRYSLEIGVIYVKVSVLEGGYGSYPSYQPPGGSGVKSTAKLVAGTEVRAPIALVWSSANGYLCSLQQKQKDGYMDRNILSQAACSHVNSLIDPYGSHADEEES